jgi:DNA-binding transcriptional LysR family regulator
VVPAASTEFLLGLVATGRLVAFDQGAVARKEPRVVWRPLVGDPLIWHVSAAWPSRTAHPAVPRFAELVARVLTADDPARVMAEEPRTPRPWAVVFPPRLTSA